MKEIAIMIREVVTDPILLSRPSRPAGADDRALAQDLMKTLDAHRHHCVGMAANMIGDACRIIAVIHQGKILILMNPIILKKSAETYEAEEGCLSIPGVRRVRRYKKIQLQFQDLNLKVRQQTFSGFSAQIIQHELDHCEGILI